MLHSLASLAILPLMLVNLGVTRLLVFVETLDELLDIRYAIPARVILGRGRGHVFGVHGADLVDGVPEVLVVLRQMTILVMVGVHNPQSGQTLRSLAWEGRDEALGEVTRNYRLDGR